ncbi:transglutaminase TgpA family protein [Halopiger goleimassiliensis]|uniref:transglutaminase TgpA family protein n=1 Tax=Halopiger goleimassiliensis TaxID=1293048 RepID=UPI0006778BC1|nr:transglutaminaseTgpA domain-containing protein [Halopiger goleimassiliensis]
MSTGTGTRPREWFGSLEFDRGGGTYRLLAIGSVLVLTASYVSVLREVTRVVGGTGTLFAIVGASLLAATILARTIRPRTAAPLAIVAGVGGFAYYLEIAGVGADVVVSALDEVVADTLTLATGLPLLQMIEAGTWTMAFVPTPVFLSWYLALRGRYVSSVIPGGMALCFLVLTGDAGTTVTLVGTLAALATVGFGDLARRDGSIAQVDLIALLFAVVIVLSLGVGVTVVPGGSSGPATAGTGPDTLEGAMDHSPDRSGIAGSVDLSPEPRFTVRTDRPSYWRTGVYDRFTGDEWLRSGQETDLGRLPVPAGEHERVEQAIRAETDLGVMPVAPHPVSVDGPAARDATVSTHGQIHTDSVLREGETYTVESAVLERDPERLQRAGTDYPDEIESHYLQRPEATSSAFDERTATITGDAETPYEKAVAIESYLRSAKSYSLDVERPDGNVAEAFLLEMQEGYCVYYATTMTQMLRAEGVPARYVTGYTSGEPIGDDTYLVRGLDAHAWVEVYFPEYGWVPFEPTPPSDRDAVHQEPLDDPSVDDLEMPAETPSEDPDPDREASTGDEDRPFEENGSETDPPEVDDPPVQTDDPVEGESNESAVVSQPDEGDGLSLPVSVSRETLALAAVVIAGFAAGVRRTGVTARAREMLALYWHGRRHDPNADAERAFRRLEGLLAREYRPRRPGESPRAYLRALEREADAEPSSDGLATDDRVQTVQACYERAVYGGGVDRGEADAAIAAVDELARERLPFVGEDRS